MDRTRSTRQHFQPRSPSGEDTQTSSRSSEESSADATPPHTSINLSPRLEDKDRKHSPRVYSANPAREMVADRMDRIIEKAARMHGNNVANNLSSASLDALKAYIEIQKEIRKAVAGERSGLDEYPEQVAALKKVNAALEKLINSEVNHYQTGPSKQLLNLSSGAVSYLLTFCTGTLLANALDMPWVSLAVIPVCWTFSNAFRL